MKNEFKQKYFSINTNFFEINVFLFEQKTFFVIDYLYVRYYEKDSDNY